MKKNYFSTLFAALMLFVAMPASAQVSSVADLFGEYRFTADVEILNSAYSDKFSGDCDVTISKASSIYYLGEIKGIAGLGGYQTITNFDATAKTIEILNPNTNFGAEGLYMSDIDGKMNIFTGDSTQYSEINYSYNPTTKEITLPDFSLVTKNSEQKVEAVIAKFTNAKLTLKSSESIEVTDLSGDWHFTAVTGGYNTMENSTLPTEWDMTLTATDDSKRAYDISLTLGKFAPLALTATFDGMQLTIPFNETYFDAENKIGLVNMYGTARPGTITFNMANENLLTITSGMTIAQDSISPEVKGGYLQWYMAGSAKREKTVEVTDTWDGVYNVKGSLAYVAIEDYEYPTEFEIEVQYFEDWGIYLITKIFGNDVTGLNNGGIRLTPSTDDPNKAEITTGGYLKTIVGGESYLCLKDMNLSNSPLTLTRLEDGTYTISDFCVTYMTYNEDWTQNHALAVFYQSVTAEKVVEEEFSWANTFTIKVPNVTVYNEDYAFPAEFEMEVQYFEEWGIYLVTKMFGNDVTGLNYGGIRFTPSANDPYKAELTTGGYLKTVEAGVSYLCLKDANMENSPLTLTRLEDGTITISDFCVTYMTYNEDYSQNHEVVALYSQEAAEEFSWVNTFTIKVPNVTVYNETYAFPAEFEMEVQYFEEWGIYLVTKMFGNDVTGLNYGGIRFTPSANDPYKAELTTGGYLKTVEAGVSYLCLKDANMENSPLTLTRLEDGTITISDFCVTYMTYNEDYSQNHEMVALYSQEAYEDEDNAVETIVVENAIQGIFDLTGRKLEAITTPGLYIVNGKKVVVK